MPKSLHSQKGKWVVIGLSSVGEKETNTKIMISSASRILGRSVEMFIPAVSKQRQSELHTTFYMDGYVFIRYEENVPYIKLQDTTYFGQVLCCQDRGSVTYSLVDDASLAPLRKGMKNLSVCKFSIGDRVRVVKGELKDLTGTVQIIYDGGEVIQVNASQRSKPMLIDFPVIYLEKVDD